MQILVLESPANAVFLKCNERITDELIFNCLAACKTIVLSSFCQSVVQNLSIQLDWPTWRDVGLPLVVGRSTHAVFAA
jgi:hypothetical protein